MPASPNQFFFFSHQFIFHIFKCIRMELLFYDMALYETIIYIALGIRVYYFIHVRNWRITTSIITGHFDAMHTPHIYECCYASRVHKPGPAHTNTTNTLMNDTNMLTHHLSLAAFLAIVVGKSFVGFLYTHIGIYICCLYYLSEITDTCPPINLSVRINSLQFFLSLHLFLRSVGHTTVCTANIKEAKCVVCTLARGNIVDVNMNRLKIVIRNYRSDLGLLHSLMQVTLNQQFREWPFSFAYVSLHCVYISQRPVFNLHPA